MSEKRPIYDERGRVTDSGLARKAAEVENEHHKKFLGIFKPSEEKIKKGEDLAERAIENGKDVMEKRLFGNKIDEKQVPETIKRRILEFKDEIGKNDIGKKDLEKILEADIGGGVRRYRTYISQMISISPLLFNYYELILDVRDGKIISEEQRKGIPD